MATSGLDGVVVAETELSHVDGERGELWLRGWRVEDLAAQGSFEVVLALLWHGDTARAPEVADALGAARVRMSERVSLVTGLDGVASMRAALAPLEGAAPLELVAAAGEVFVAWSCRAAGRVDPGPDPSLPHADDLVRRLRGSVDPARARAFAAYLATVADHGMNASTFTARVVASTGSDDTSAVVAALGALKGPLHGGAPGPVLDMLDAISEPSAARSWLARELAEGRRIMGMGHRIYRVRDPRVAVLESALATLRAAGVDSPRWALARVVEAEATQLLAEKQPTRPLRANVEFATAVLLEVVGVDRAAFTAAFAVGRVAGWLAHTEEQRRTGRLLRPQSRYVGPVPSGVTAS